MDMYNLDGSQGAMCGNGIRCVAKFAYDYGIVNKEHISVDTRSGILCFVKNFCRSAESSSQTELFSRTMVE